jgi:hypothetical protein
VRETDDEWYTRIRTTPVESYYEVNPLVSDLAEIARRCATDPSLRAIKDQDATMVPCTCDECEGTSFV